MEYTKLGRAGLDVSRVCLGCVSYGGDNPAWSLGEEKSRRQYFRHREPVFAKTEDAGGKVIDHVDQLAKPRGVPRAHVALAWLLAKPTITAPIVGATKPHHLDGALGSVSVRLSGDKIAALEEPSRAVVGFV
jgi:aryl-alcohol dehydrogenase-like predicted oxidoreductase